jgi:hypothetical protein
MDIEPLQMLPPAQQAYGFPEPPLASATGVDFDSQPSFDEGMLHGIPRLAGSRSPSLYGQNDLAALFNGIDVSSATGGDAVVEEVEAPGVRPVEEDNIIIVPFIPGQLDCTKCCTVQELLHENGKIQKHIILCCICLDSYTYVLLYR